MRREEVLEAARECICGDREQDYGTPEDNFATIACLWEAYLAGACIGGDFEIDIRPRDVAAMMALLKIARIATGDGKSDNWVDLAGYAACGGEIDTKK